MTEKLRLVLWMTRPFNSNQKTKMHWASDWLEYFTNPQSRMVVLMVFEGKKCQDIRQRLDISQETLEGIIAHIRKKTHFRQFCVRSIESGRFFADWGFRGMSDPAF